MTVAATGTSEDERRLIRGVCGRYHPPRNHILAFYVPVLRIQEELERDGKAYTFAYHPELAPACAISNTAHEETLAHEIGHLLLNPGRHENDRNNLMHSSDEPRTGHALTEHQVFLINDTVRGHFGPGGSPSSRRCS